MSHPSANSYLEQVAGEGDFHSSGDFTISLKAAIEKLGVSQLPRESAWVLKVVQAGVSLGATAIEVKQGSSVTSFSLVWSGSFDLEGLQEALVSIDFQGPPGIRHLAIALRAVGFGQRRSYRFAVHSGQQSQLLSWDGEEIRRETRDGDPALTGVLTLEVEFRPDHRGRLLGISSVAARAAMRESDELVQQAAVCPVPLTLDGRRLDVLGGCNIPPPGSREGRRPGQALLCLAWSAPAVEGEPGLHLPSGVELAQRRRFRLANPLANPLTSGRAFLLYGAKNELNAEFLCQLNYHFNVGWSMKTNEYQVQQAQARPSLIHWVIDGVVCASVAIVSDGSPTRLDLYVSAAGLPTDISGMVPQLEGPVVEERLRRAIDFAHATIDVVHSKLSGHHHNYTRKTALLGSGVGLLTFLGGPYAWAAGLFFGVLFSPAIGLAGIEAARASRFSRRLAEDCQTQIVSLRSKLEKTPKGA